MCSPEGMGEAQGVSSVMAAKQTNRDRREDSKRVMNDYAYRTSKTISDSALQAAKLAVKNHQLSLNRAETLGSLRNNFSDTGSLLGSTNLQNKVKSAVSSAREANRLAGAMLDLNTKTALRSSRNNLRMKLNRLEEASSTIGEQLAAVAAIGANVVAATYEPKPPTDTDWASGSPPGGSSLTTGVMPSPSKNWFQ